MQYENIVDVWFGSQIGVQTDILQNYSMSDESKQNSNHNLSNRY